MFELCCEDAQRQKHAGIGAADFLWEPKLRGFELTISDFILLLTRLDSANCFRSGPVLFMFLIKNTVKYI